MCCFAFSGAKELISSTLKGLETVFAMFFHGIWLFGVQNQGIYSSLCGLDADKCSKMREIGIF